ncbi:MAG TPA: hypothetical protein VM600_06895 [Actinomycetota bacterium]|nr:hypothetical protein [Actinomycetota bacterium]
MRRIIVVAAIAALALAMTPARAEDKTGTILFPTGTAARVHRCAYTVDKAASQGIFGYTIKVTGEADFSLKAAGGGPADFDIAFYTGDEPAECDGANSVANQWVPHNAPVDDTNDEIGKVPADALSAIIYMFAGPPNSAFEYKEVVAE